MHHFQFRDKRLFCEEIPVDTIAEAANTPLYLYSKQTILDNFREIKTAFSELDHLICYALKANSNERILSLLAKEGAGADVVSGGEIYLALKAGFSPDKIVFAGVGKTVEEIEYALNSGVLSLNVESGQELQVINEIAGRCGKVADIAFRVNPNIDIHGHPYISTGKSENKFGIDVAEMRELVIEAQSSANVKIIGLHCHTGSQIMESMPYLSASRFLATLKDELWGEGVAITHVDIGGGLGVDYESVLNDAGQPESALGGQDILKEIMPELKQLKCKVLFEPGRSIVANSGILITKVLYVKETRGKKFVIVDAAMNDLIRPSLYQAYHKILPVRKNNREITEVDVVGPVCESGDFLAKKRLLPNVERGELLAVMTAGAYGFSLSSNYNARVRPAEVMVDGSEFEVIRERGKLEDLWK